MKNNRIDTRSLTGVALFTAIVVVLQFLGSFVRFGPFSISLVLIPIVVGAALYGPWAGAWLGFVFGLVVLLSGDAAPFMVVSPLGTILTVLLKGGLAGLLAGLTYRLVAKQNEAVGVIAAAIVCPVVNTGVFLLGCLLFFLPTITEWGTAAGFPNVGNYMIFGLVGGNFLFEVLINIVLSPVIVRLIKLGRGTKDRRTNEITSSHWFELIISFLVPLVGFILGAILLAKEESEKKALGKACIVLAIIPTLVSGLVILL